MIRRAFTALVASALVSGVIALPAPVQGVDLIAPTYYVGHVVNEYEVGSPCASPDYWTDGDWVSDRGEGEYDSDDDAIQDAVDNAASGSIVHICAGTYVFDDEVVLEEGDSMTFEGDGQNATILDGDESTRIFNADAHGEEDNGGTMTLRDLSIVDAHTVSSEDNGGAIIADGLSLERVDISGSDGAYNGGALYTEGHVSIVDSQITDNDADLDGGALYAWDESGAERTVTVSGSDIDDNSAGDNAAAIAASGDLTIVRSNIRRNVAVNNVGAISVEGNLVVDDSLFGQNESENGGAGAIRAVTDGATVEISGSAFSSNEAFLLGGALIMQNLQALTIEHSTFEFNQSEFEFGGAINLFQVEEVTVIGSQFIGNEAHGGDFGGNGNGGAIDGCDIGSFTSVGSRYIDNVSTQFGGAIGLFGVSCFSPGVVRLRGNQFVGNSATDEGGALWLSGELVSMTGNRFFRNESGGLGGAIYGGWGSEDLETGIVRRNTFRKNYAEEGAGAIWLPGSIELLTRNTFQSNRTGGNGGAVALTGLQGREWRAVKGNRILRNTAEGSGGAFYIQCSSLSRSERARLVAANRLAGNRAYDDRRTSRIYQANIC